MKQIYKTLERILGAIFPQMRKTLSPVKVVDRNAIRQPKKAK